MLSIVRQFMCLLLITGLSACSVEHDKPTVRTQQKLRVIASILVKDYGSLARYPKDIDELNESIRRQANDPEELLRDHHGNQIRYLAVGKNGNPVIYSIGEDNKDSLGDGDDLALEIIR